MLDVQVNDSASSGGYSLKKAGESVSFLPLKFKSALWRMNLSRFHPDFLPIQILSLGGKMTELYTVAT